MPVVFFCRKSASYSVKWKENNALAITPQATPSKAIETNFANVHEKSGVTPLSISVYVA